VWTEGLVRKPPTLKLIFLFDSIADLCSGGPKTAHTPTATNWALLVNRNDRGRIQNNNSAIELSHVWMDVPTLLARSHCISHQSGCGLLLVLCCLSFSNLWVPKFVLFTFLLINTMRVACWAARADRFWYRGEWRSVFGAVPLGDPPNLCVGLSPKCLSQCYCVVVGTWALTENRASACNIGWNFYLFLLYSNTTWLQLVRSLLAPFFLPKGNMKLVF